MKRTILTSLLTLSIVFNTMGAFAAGVGYVDYSKVSAQCSLAKKYKSELDKKVAAIKSYEAAQANSIKAAKTDAQKKQIADNALKQIQIKKQDYVTTRDRYEADLSAKLAAAAEQVRIAKKLDIIIRKDVSVSGGTDCTNDILKILK